MEAFKNVFNEKFVNTLASNIAFYDESFKKKEYVIEILKTLESLELKDRMRLISRLIKLFSSLDYLKLLTVLIKVKKHFYEKPNISLSSMVFPDFVEVYGLNYLKESLKALEQFTINSSSEFAIRCFIIKYEKQTMQKMLTFAKNKNEHIRRFASEGCRPRLPWAISLKTLKKDPTLIMLILDILKDDESLYVRRSVANNLNDIAKDNKEIVFTFVKKNLNKNKNLDWLCKHASRTLLKKGEREILDLFSYKKIKNLKIKNFKLQKEVKVDNFLNFSFDVISSEVLSFLRIEYELDFMMANNKRSKKVFMISSSKVNNTNKIVVKKHNFKKITTRKYYKGIHYLSIIINGEKTLCQSFNLI